MASILDISLISGFSSIFVILFIFALVYAVLEAKKPLGENKALNGFLAATIALMFLFYQPAVAIVQDTVPWFLVMLVGVVFVLIISQSIGAPIPDTLKANVGTWVLIIGVFLIILNVSLQVGQNVGPFLANNGTADVVEAGGPGDVGSNQFSQNLGATLFHPKVLAMLLIFMVATFTVLWMGYV